MRTTLRQARRGFTIAEMVIACFLLSLLAVLIGNAWVTFGRTAISASARGRVAQEANLAAEALARDVGMLAHDDSQNDSGYQKAMYLADGSLVLTVDDGTGPTRTITYTCNSSASTLVRKDSNDPPDAPGRVVAALVEGFRAYSSHDVNDPTVTGVQVDLTFTHRTFDRVYVGNAWVFHNDHTRLYSLFIPDPQR